jgi:hypothetical protein
VLIETLVAVAVLIVAIGALVLAVRWALYVPAVLAEGLGIASGVARATELGRGIRVRLSLAAVGVLILELLSVGAVAAIVAVVVGLSAGSAVVGIATYLGVTLIGNVLWAPFLPAMLALAYREMARTRAAAPSAVPGGSSEGN